MRAFEYAGPESLDEALHLEGAFLAGGTTLVDLMKLEVMTPAQVIDINRLPLRGIHQDPTGVRIGALELMEDVARNEAIYPVIRQALEKSASPQLRNMATIGGNLLQRTRCGFFRDVTTPCNKREPGTGCPAQAAQNRPHAILGTSTSCAATHPSDLAVALVALDASVTLATTEGTREIKLADLYELPGDTPEVETRLFPGELITEVTVPDLPWAATRSRYVKIRDRQSYEFALTSAAVALDLAAGGVRDVRVAAGGVGTVPWRLPAVEEALRGKPATTESFQRAAELATEGARSLADNAFKIPLLQRTIVRALVEATR